ncbi:MAG: hypothetical protein JSW40_00335 [Candidatus Omnitrophota bacterium]|nr:MAG: hypothetical protein JSW40_00335 [Candidatus Omnitrophota bacterium]
MGRGEQEPRIRKLWGMVVMCLLLANVSSYAQTVIRLKSGKIVEGEFIAKTDKYVKVKFNNVELTYWLDDVESVRLSDGTKVYPKITPTGIEKEPAVSPPLVNKPTQPQASTLQEPAAEVQK